MSGHSKWSQIKRKKVVADVKKSKIFTKIAQAITLAVKEAGPDPAMNPKLRLAIDKAKGANMPIANIERAIERGTGKSSTLNIQELLIEGYGPGGVALLIEAITDNRNRTIPEIRRILEQGGGKMGSEGSVKWMFERVGKIILNSQEKNINDIELIAIEAGASDIFNFEEEVLVVSLPQDLEILKNKLREAGLDIKSSSLGFIPKTLTEVKKEDAEKIENLVEMLEDMDDVQDVTTNMSAE